eukprot:TRINITY_DN17085_c0_g1_i1.p1 TRINITY_DN17085_c0_g1~~TRINITY_DN17085_c0_g1_i1.p1  ORF type:complete len:1124 (-),score=265.88 TRINITY_DN17085_c0_g1_i1:472-3843(-)
MGDPAPHLSFFKSVNKALAADFDHQRSHKTRRRSSADQSIDAVRRLSRPPEHFHDVEAQLLKRPSKLLLPEDGNDGMDRQVSPGALELESSGGRQQQQRVSGSERPRQPSIAEGQARRTSFACHGLVLRSDDDFKPTLAHARKSYESEGSSEQSGSRRGSRSNRRSGFCAGSLATLMAIKENIGRRKASKEAKEREAENADGDKGKRLQFLAVSETSVGRGSIMENALDKLGNDPLQRQDSDDRQRGKTSRAIENRTASPHPLLRRQNSEREDPGIAAFRQPVTARKNIDLDDDADARVKAVQNAKRIHTTLQLIADDATKFADKIARKREQQDRKDAEAKSETHDTKRATNKLRMARRNDISRRLHAQNVVHASALAREHSGSLLQEHSSAVGTIRHHANAALVAAATLLTLQRKSGGGGDAGADEELEDEDWQSSEGSSDGMSRSSSDASLASTSSSSGSSEWVDEHIDDDDEAAPHCDERLLIRERRSTFGGGELARNSAILGTAEQSRMSMHRREAVLSLEVIAEVKRRADKLAAKGRRLTGISAPVNLPPGGKLAVDVAEPRWNGPRGKLPEVPRLRNKFRDQAAILSGFDIQQAHTVKKELQLMMRDFDLERGDVEELSSEYQLSQRYLKAAQARKIYQQRAAAALTIQRAWKGSGARKLFRLIASEKVKAACTLQRVWRRARWMRLPLQLRIDSRKRKHRAAVTLQRVVRGLLTRRRVHDGWALHRLGRDMSSLQELFQPRLEPLCTRLQACGRGFLARRRCARLRALRQAETEAAEAARREAAAATAAAKAAEAEAVDSDGDSEADSPLSPMSGRRTDGAVLRGRLGISVAKPPRLSNAALLPFAFATARTSPRSGPRKSNLDIATAGDVTSPRSLRGNKRGGIEPRQQLSTKLSSVSSGGGGASSAEDKLLRPSPMSCASTMAGGALSSSLSKWSDDLDEDCSRQVSQASADENPPSEEPTLKKEAPEAELVPREKGRLPIVHGLRTTKTLSMPRAITEKLAIREQVDCLQEEVVWTRGLRLPSRGRRRAPRKIQPIASAPARSCQPVVAVPSSRPQRRRRFVLAEEHEGGQQNEVEVEEILRRPANACSQADSLAGVKCRVLAPLRHGSMVCY